MTGFIDSRAGLARRQLEVTHQRLAIAGARQQCRRHSDQHILMAPAKALGEAQSMCQGPKPKTEAVEDLEDSPLS